MRKFPVERNKDLKPSDPNGNGHGPQLLPTDDVEDAIASMLRIWGVYVTAGVLGQYREQLAGLPAPAVLEAVKRWLREPPADRAARPHELRTMAEREEVRTSTPAADVEALRRRRATPAEIDDVFAAVGIRQPHSPFVRELIRYREAYRAQWAAEAEEPGARMDTTSRHAPDQP